MDVAQFRRRRLRGLAARTQRRRIACHEGGILWSRSLQPACIDRGGADLSAQGRPGCSQAGALPVLVLRSFRRGHAGVWLCCNFWPRRIMRGRSAGAIDRAAAARGRVESWNRRDAHMAETLEALAAHLEGRGRKAKIVLWEHNSHLGDARATEIGEGGEFNVGQLVRERYPGQSVLVGFTTHHGTVTAASNWDSPAERKRVRPALPGSYEALFHELGIGRFMLGLRSGAPMEGLRGPRLERAIGVIYRPETERMSHYFHARLSDQFDAVLHFDETRAVEPLERIAAPS